MGFPIPAWPTRGYPNTVQVVDASTGVDVVVIAALKCRWWSSQGYILDEMGLPHFVADALNGQCDYDPLLAEGQFMVTTPATDAFTGPPERWLIDHVDNQGGRYFTLGFHARKVPT